MSDSVETSRTPWHLWVIGIFCLVTSGMGAFDYVMTATNNEAYLANVPQETLDFYFGLPGWMFVLFAISSFGGLIGAVLLLLRKKLSFSFLAAGLAAGVIATIVTYTSGGLEIMGAAAFVTGVVFLAIAALILVYVRRMTGRGVLT